MCSVALLVLTSGCTGPVAIFPEVPAGSTGHLDGEGVDGTSGSGADDSQSGDDDTDGTDDTDDTDGTHSGDTQDTGATDDSDTGELDVGVFLRPLAEDPTPRLVAAAESGSPSTVYVSETVLGNYGSRVIDHTFQLRYDLDGVLLLEQIVTPWIDVWTSVAEHARIPMTDAALGDHRICVRVDWPADIHPQNDIDCVDFALVVADVDLAPELIRVTEPGGVEPDVDLPLGIQIAALRVHVRAETIAVRLHRGFAVPLHVTIGEASGDVWAEVARHGDGEELIQLDLLDGLPPTPTVPGEFRICVASRLGFDPSSANDEYCDPRSYRIVND